MISILIYINFFYLEYFNCHYSIKSKNNKIFNYDNSLK